MTWRKKNKFELKFIKENYDNYYLREIEKTEEKLKILINEKYKLMLEDFIDLVDYSIEIKEGEFDCYDYVAVKCDTQTIHGTTIGYEEIFNKVVDVYENLLRQDMKKMIEELDKEQQKQMYDILEAYVNTDEEY